MKQMISVAKDRSICLWDTMSHEILQRIKDTPNYYFQDSQLSAAAFIDKGKRLLVADKFIKAYQVDVNEQIKTQIQSLDSFKLD